MFGQRAGSWSKVICRRWRKSWFWLLPLCTGTKSLPVLQVTRTPISSCVKCWTRCRLLMGTSGDLCRGVVLHCVQLLTRRPTCLFSVMPDQARGTQPRAVISYWYSSSSSSSAGSVQCLSSLTIRNWECWDMSGAGCF